MRWNPSMEYVNVLVFLFFLFGNPWQYMITRGSSIHIWLIIYRKNELRDAVIKSCLEATSPKVACVSVRDVVKVMADVASTLQRR